MMNQLQTSNPRYPGPVICSDCGNRLESIGWIEVYETESDGSYAGIEYVCSDCMNERNR